MKMDVEKILPTHESHQTSVYLREFYRVLGFLPLQFRRNWERLNDSVGV